LLFLIIYQLYSDQRLFVMCPYTREGPSWSWSYGSWIYNYLYNHCLSPLKLGVH